MKYRKVVFIVIYAETKKGVEYLLLRRKLHWKGWEFSKGGVEPFETKKNAVKRELFEETGLFPLKIKKFNFSGKYEFEKELQEKSGLKGQEFHLYSVEVKKSKVKFDKREHSGLTWTDFKKAEKILRWPDQKKSLRIVNEWLKTTVQAWPVRRKIS